MATGHGLAAEWRTLHVAARLNGFPGAADLTFWKNTRWGKGHASLDGGVSSACGITFTPSKVRWVEPRDICVQCKTEAERQMKLLRDLISQDATHVE